MPDITNPQIVRFSNEKARVAADALEDIYHTAKRFQQEWAALTASTSVANTTDEVADGAHGSAGNLRDGRKPVTGALINLIKNLCDQVVSFLESVPNGQTDTRIVLIQRASVNGRSRI